MSALYDANTNTQIYELKDFNYAPYLFLEHKFGISFKKSYFNKYWLYKNDEVIGSIYRNTDLEIVISLFGNGKPFCKRQFEEHSAISKIEKIYAKYYA